MMACAFDGPMPLSVCSVAESAVLIFIKSAACTIKAAGAAHSSTMATSLVSFIRLIYAQHVAQDFCRHLLIFIKSAACTIKAAGAAHSSTMATSLVSFIRLIYAQHVAQDFCRHFLFFWRRSNAAHGVFKRRGSGRLPARPPPPVGQGRGGFRRVRNTRERFL